MSQGIFSLIITDDDPEDRDFISEALRNKGFSGVAGIFGNGRELVNYLRADAKNRPDLILLDLNMPIFDGYQTLQELQGTEKWKDIPVMVLTSSFNENDEVFCRTNGCTDYIRKPMSFSEFEELAERIIGMLPSNRSAQLV